MHILRHEAWLVKQMRTREWESGIRSVWLIADGVWLGTKRGSEKSLWQIADSSEQSGAWETSAGSSVAIDGPTLEKTPDPFSSTLLRNVMNVKSKRNAKGKHGYPSRVATSQKKKATGNGGLFITPLPFSGRSSAGCSHVRASLSPPLGRPETLWGDLGGGMGTHRASGDVKAGTD